MSRVVLRTATNKDFEEWYGAKPELTLRAWVADVDGVPAAFAGFILHPAFVEVFSSMKADHGLPALTVYRNAAKLFDTMKVYGLPLLAVADPARKNSGKFLERLGFELKVKSATGDVYQWK